MRLASSPHRYGAGCSKGFPDKMTAYHVDEVTESRLYVLVEESGTLPDECLSKPS